MDDGCSHAEARCFELESCQTMAVTYSTSCSTATTDLRGEGELIATLQLITHTPAVWIGKAP